MRLDLISDKRWASVIVVLDYLEDSLRDAKPHRRMRTGGTPSGRLDLTASLEPVRVGLVRRSFSLPSGPFEDAEEKHSENSRQSNFKVRMEKSKGTWHLCKAISTELLDAHGGNTPHLPYLSHHSSDD